MVEDYKIEQRWGCAEPTGRYVMYGKGKSRPEMKFVERYHTPAGIFFPEEWRVKALEAIQADGETELLEKIKEHCRENCAWLRKEKDLEEYAVDCLCSRAYRHWPEFEYDETIIWM